MVVSAHAQSTNKAFYDDRERGWYWYEDPMEETEEEQENETPNTSSSNLTATEIIEKQRKSFNEALSAAVVNPTPENIKNYLAITQLINAQAERFSEGFKRAIWVSPQYDYTLNGRPTTNQAIAAYSQAKVKVANQSLEKIASEKGLLYFFRSDCPYCAKFSPVLKQFGERYGFTIIPVSLDGRGTKEFPYPKQSVSMANQLNVKVVPATFLVDPDNNTVSTIGYGFSDWSTLSAKVLNANQQMHQQGVQ